VHIESSKVKNIHNFDDKKMYFSVLKQSLETSITKYFYQEKSKERKMHFQTVSYFNHK
jgi:hypothetical protein